MFIFVPSLDFLHNRSCNTSNVKHVSHHSHPWKSPQLHDPSPGKAPPPRSWSCSVTVCSFPSLPGILIMMSMCREVHVYEYIPSVRQTELCHYHELYYDAACTLGAYHPLLYEKLLVQRLNMGTQADLHHKGKVVLPGFRALRCPVTSPNNTYS